MTTTPYGVIASHPTCTKNKVGFPFPCACPECLRESQRGTPERSVASHLDVQVGGDHYKNFKIQPVEFITTNGLGFLEGCIIKRVCRHGAKNGREDLEKAIHELQLLIELHYKV